MNNRFPLLDFDAATECYKEVILHVKENRYSPDLSFSHEKLKHPTDYQPLSVSAVSSLREELLEIAIKFQIDKSKKRSSEFDNAVTAWLADHTSFKSSEMFKDEVWAALSLLVWADVIFWRYGESNQERYFGGGRRGAIQRLWQRALVLDKGSESSNRWELVEKLTEDNLVQIMERPSIAGSPLLAKAIAEVLVEFAEKGITQSREKIFRELVIRFRLRNLTLDFHYLSKEEIRAEIISLLPSDIADYIK